jgi:hypothetical protein
MKKYQLWAEQHGRIAETDTWDLALTRSTREVFDEEGLEVCVYELVAIVASERVPIVNDLREQQKQVELQTAVDNLAAGSTAAVTCEENARACAEMISRGVRTSAAVAANGPVFDPYEPDWSKIPQKFTHAATDDGGARWVYAGVPMRHDPLLLWGYGGGAQRKLDFVDNNPDWKSSLRVRPQS